MKVLYHQEGKAPKELEVLHKHADGTVDIGIKGENPIVTRCPIVEIAKPGYATAVGGPVEPAKPVEPKKH